jgi:glycosyltransferase involved in cell wall biosynthesis
LSTKSRLATCWKCLLVVESIEAERRRGVSSMSTDTVELSVVMPCLNEAETLETCIRKAQRAIRAHNLSAEVVVADNGSSDVSRETARRSGARVVEVAVRGYGAALMGGIEAARGRFILMADADDSYDFGALYPFVEKLREGYDLVMGSRFKGRIERGAMPPLHRYLGNPLLTGILNTFFHAGISDAHCGMRAFTREAYGKMRLMATGMEFASEMVIKAGQAGLRMTEVPVTLHRDGRSRPPHLRSFRDGWRHLRLMLLFSPTWLYLIPGTVLALLGILIMAMLLTGPVRVGGLYLGVHWLTLGSLLTLLGFNIACTGAFAKVYALTGGFESENPFLLKALRHFRLETGLVIGSLTFLVGFFVDLAILITWVSRDFGPLGAVHPAIVAATVMALGVQMVFASFFLSILGIREPR